MNTNDNFFIGWKGNTNDDHKKWIRRILIPFFIGVPLLILGIVLFTKPFGTGVFELGNVKSFTGIYYEEPFPVFILDEGQLPEPTNTSALLVGFGKNGAKTFMQPIQEEKGSLDGRRLKIQGTLIYGEGKTLIELTKKEDSVLEILEPEIKVVDTPRMSQKTLKGEIVDPKCWFGVMKPGEGKVHKSCAIRCISGGIPPVFKAQNGSSFDYYVIKGTKDQDINQDVLEFIGENIQFHGNTYQKNGWNVVQLNPMNIIYLN